MSEELEETPPLPPATASASIVLVEDRTAFRHALDGLLEGSGPLALDAERASGFRYSSRAYLVQAHREGTPNYLIDPVGVGALDDITHELSDLEWIIHAAHQDLPCLRETGINPVTLFDTELGARLAGLPRVGLQGVMEDVLGLSLAKEHSAADWSTRPLPEPWLNYAALDVEYLPQVRNEIHRILSEQDKWDIAAEEFQAQLSLTPHSPRSEPWRRLSGLHQIRGARKLAIARELWETREAYAEEIDTAPGRLVPDRALVAAVLADPPTKKELAALKSFHGRASRSELDRWWDAIDRGRTTENLPEARTPSEGPPPPRIWSDKNPVAWARLNGAKEELSRLGEERSIPSENLLTPDFLRRLCWDAPADISPEGIRQTLLDKGARVWQVDIVSEALSRVFVEANQPEGTSPGSDS
jgi:ribonuclease D